MPVINLPIVGGAYADTHKSIGLQTCINMYPEVTQDSQKTVAALLPTPAMSTLFDKGIADKCRAFTALSNGSLYAVYGNALYKLDDKFDALPLAALDGVSPVIVAENSLFACFVTDAAVFTLNMQTNEWAQYGAQLTFEADDVVTLAQRFIFNKRGTGQIYWTDTLSTNIDPLSYATAEASPDNVTALKVHQKMLWVFGELTVEIWYATGNNDAPFVPMQGTTIYAGCLLRHTIRKFGESLVWMANSENGNCQIVMTQGNQVQRISTHALEKELLTYDTDDAISYVYQYEGHNFYVINFPKAGKTWAYDGTTGLWHQRALFKDGAFYQHPALYHAMWQGKHVFAHADKVLLMGIGKNSRDMIGDETLTQVRERTTHATSRSQGMVRHNRLTLIAEQATSHTNSNPQVMLSWSDNDGHTWSDTRWRGLGKRGQYKYRTFWTRLGASRNRAYRIRVTDSATLVITGAELEVS